MRYSEWIKAAREANRVADEALRRSRSAKSTPIHDPDHVLVSRALLREAADLIKETFGGIDMVRRLREAAGEGEG